MTLQKDMWRKIDNNKDNVYIRNHIDLVYENNKLVALKDHFVDRIISYRKLVNTNFSDFEYMEEIDSMLSYKKGKVYQLSTGAKPSFQDHLILTKVELTNEDLERYHKDYDLAEPIYLDELKQDIQDKILAGEI